MGNGKGTRDEALGTSEARVACIASVSVRFRGKESKTARKMERVKERGEGGEER